VVWEEGTFKSYKCYNNVPAYVYNKVYFIYRTRTSSVLKGLKTSRSHKCIAVVVTRLEGGRSGV